MFKIADEVEIINGIGKGYKGTVEAVAENDLDSRTYTIKLLHADNQTHTVVDKLEKDLKLVKASKNKTSKTKKKDAEPVKETVSSYDQLIETYDILRRNLTVSELELFSDVVTKDLDDSKKLFEMMYQFPISSLVKIKRDVEAGLKEGK